MSTRRKRAKAVLVNQTITYKTLDEPPAPPSAIRQAMVEQALHLKPGDLDPDRVKLRNRLHSLRYTKVLDKVLPDPTTVDKQTMESVKQVLQRAEEDGARKVEV